MGTSSVSISAEGYVSNGTDQVDVDMSITATLSQASLDYQLSSGGSSVISVVSSSSGTRQASISSAR